MVAISKGLEMQINIDKKTGVLVTIIAVLLTTILGIPDEQLPPWVTNLAVWVSEDRITLADMIVSIEHLINN